MLLSDGMRSLCQKRICLYFRYLILFTFKGSVHFRTMLFTYAQLPVKGSFLSLFKLVCCAFGTGCGQFPVKLHFTHIMVQKIILSSLFIFGFLSLKGQEQPVRTLKEVMEIALNNNSTLRRSEIEQQRRAIDHRQARLNVLPSISANLGHGISQGRSVDPTTNQFTESTFSSGSQGLSADMTLFNGLRMLHDIRMKGEARQAGLLEQEGQIHTFKLDVVESYIQVLTANDMLEQSRNQLEVTREQLWRAEVMQAEGAMAPGDYFDLRGQSKNDENVVAFNEQSLKTTRLRLAKLMQIDEENLGQLAALDLSLTNTGKANTGNANTGKANTGKANTGKQDGREEQDLFGQAQESLPHIRALEHRIRESKQQIGIAKSGFYPSLGLGAGLNSRYSDQYTTSYGTQFNQNLGKYISVNLRIPIFNRLQTLNQVKVARLAYEDAQLQREIQLQTLKEETAKAVFDLKTTAQSVRNLEEQVLHYTESFRIAREHFEAGASNSLLFLTAKNKADAARQQLVIKQYEFLLQQYINDYYRGSLVF